MAQSVNAKIVE